MVFPTVGQILYMKDDRLAIGIYGECALESVGAIIDRPAVCDYDLTNLMQIRSA